MANVKKNRNYLKKALQKVIITDYKANYQALNHF